jgi:hypothetical protein
MSFLTSQRQRREVENERRHQAREETDAQRAAMRAEAERRCPDVDDHYRACALDVPPTVSGGSEFTRRLNDMYAQGYRLSHLCWENGPIGGQIIQVYEHAFHDEVPQPSRQNPVHWEATD